MKSKLLKNYLYNIIMIFTSIIFPMLLFPYSSRILTPEYYGKYSFASSIVGYFITFAALGIPTYGLRELVKSKINGRENLKKTFTEINLIYICSSIINFIFFLIIIFSFDKLKQEYKLFLVLGLDVIFSFCGLDYFFIALENHKRRTIRLLITRIISMIFLFTFVKEPKDYIVYALVILLPPLMARIIDFITIREYISINLKELEIKKHIKPLMIIFFYLVSTNIYLNLDSTMLGIIVGDIAVGFYSVAIKMTKIVIPLITSLGLVLSPRMITRIKEKDTLNLFKDMDLYLNFIFFTGIPIVLLLFTLSENIIIIFSGVEYLSAEMPMKIMQPIILFISISGFSSAQILLPSNREDMVLKISIVGLISNFVLNFLLIPKYEIIGAGLATLVSEFIVCFLRFNGVKRLFNEYKMFNQDRINYIWTAIICFCISEVLKQSKLITNIYLEFVLISSIFGIVYIILLGIKKEYFITLGIEKIKIFYKNRS